MRPDVYTKTYTRALYKNATSGFNARWLDADDWAFLEKVRETGRIDCSSTYGQDYRSYKYGTDEELDYWSRHWTEEPDITRRLGALPPTPQELERRTKATESRRLNRIAVSELRAETEREHKEQQAQLRDERERRILRNMLADMEWEASEALERAKRAALVTPTGHVQPEVEKPKRRLSYRRPAPPRTLCLLTDDRNRYVPEWKAPNHPDRVKARKLEKLRVLSQQVKEQRKRFQDLIYRFAIKTDLAAGIAAKKAAEEHAAKAAGAQLTWAWAARTAEQAEADKTQAAVTHNVKRLIIKAIRGTNHQWTIEDLMAEIGCSDRELVKRCADELAYRGEIGKKSDWRESHQ